MNIFAISSLVVLFSSTIISVLVFWKGRGTESKLLGFFCLSVIVWGLGTFKLATTTVYDTALFWRRIANISVIFSPVFYFHFIYTFLKLRRRYFKGILLFAYLSGIIFLVLNLFFPKEFFIGGLRFVFNEFYYTDWHQHKSVIYLFFHITYFWILLPYSLVLLLIAFKSSQGLFRNQLKYFIVGSVIGWLGPGFVWPIEFGIDIYPYSNFLVAIYPVLWAYAIIKHRLMDIKVAITRAGLFLFFYIPMLSVPFFIGYKTQSWVWSTVSAVVLATVAPIVYSILQRKAEDVILAQQRNYQKLLLQAGEEIAKEHDLNNLVDLVNNTIGKLTKASFVKTFIQNETYGNFSLKENSSYNEIIQTLIDKKVPINSQQISNELNNHLKKSFNNECALIIPILTDGDLLGFILLGEKKDKSIYSQDDVNIFKILSHQIALAVENCLFFDEFKKAQEKIFNAEKLATIGGLADGVAHQIKNRLNHFSLAAGKMKIEIKKFLVNHPEASKSSDYCELFKSLSKTNDSLSSNVQKTNNIIRGILDYAKTQEKETYFSEFSLLDTLNQAVDLLKVKHSISGCPVELGNINKDTVIYGVKAQIMEVLFNIIDNSYEAVLERAKTDNISPKIEIAFEENNQNITITIKDNGIGIKEEDKLKIFAPFFTTKSSEKVSGTGVGMYIVKRLIEENHGGKIGFNSKYGEGTTFTIEIPTSE